MIGIVFFFVFYQHDFSQEKINISSDSILARKDILDVFIRNSKWYSKKHPEPGKKKLFFSFMPFSGSSSGEGVAISAINASFYLGDRNTTKLSNILFYPSTNFNSRFQFKVFPNLWFRKNNWYLAGKFEVSYMEQKTYGLGGNTSIDSLNIIYFNAVKSYLILNRKIFPNFYLGIGHVFDNFYNIDEEWDEPWKSQFMQYEYGTSEQAFSSGVTFNILYDSRKNIINPLSGFYLSLLYRINTSFFGSDYDWASLTLSVKKYINFSNLRHRTLAFWGLYWGNWGEIPYLNLPGTALDYTGWTGRGYYRARYIGEEMIYAETEYRFDITRNGLWGAVVFANAQSLIEPDINRFRHVKPAAGLGLRLKFNKYSDSNISFDVAFGKESFNWYVCLNEVF